jgi:hypothetical protein
MRPRTTSEKVFHLRFTSGAIHDLPIDKKNSKGLQATDAKIETHNTKLAAAHTKVNDARTKLIDLYAQYDQPGSDRAMLQTRINTTIKMEERASVAFNEQVAIGRGLIGLGSGKVQVLLPP